MMSTHYLPRDLDRETSEAARERLPGIDKRTTRLPSRIVFISTPGRADTDMWLDGRA